MAGDEINLLDITRGTVTAPAGCGKTHLIAQSLKRYGGSKPILVLTHTNAGVAALRQRLDRAGVSPRSYRLSTIDGWAMRLAAWFPRRSGIKETSLRLINPAIDYPEIRRSALELVRNGHLHDLLRANYAHLIVDEHQDSSEEQHDAIYYASNSVPVCILGDPLQAVFSFNNLAEWDGKVCVQFPLKGELSSPWRWRNAGTEGLGEWLLHVRSCLKDGRSVDLTNAPSEVEWMSLDSRNDRQNQLRAARTKPPSDNGSVLIIGDSTNPQSQRDFAAQTHGAVTVEAVDLRDLVSFARMLDFQNENALEKIANFAGSIMTNVGPADLLRRVEVLERGTERKQASAVERAALRFKNERSPKAATDLLVEMGKEGGVRAHRPAVLRVCVKALQSCDSSEGNSFLDAVIREREESRALGRPLPSRAVGSTLLLKGLEADVSVILDAAHHGAKSLYVAMTRGSRKLVICAEESLICKPAV